MTSPAVAEGARSERGVVAIVVGLTMTAMCVAAAMVLDFGLVRLDRQGNKSTTDMASAAGIRALEGGDGQPKPWRAVCQALRYLRANPHGAELDDLDGVWNTGNSILVADNSADSPCTPGSIKQSASCVPGDLSTWAWYSGTAAGGRIAVDIKSGYRVSDGGFPEEATIAGDTGDPAQNGCDQLAVIIEETRTPGFGSLATSGDLVSRVRSVARVTIGEQGDAAVALLLLEQHDCLVIDIQGDSGARVLVEGSGDRPGMIHSDSLGDGALCTSTDKIMDGDFSSPPRIWAEDAENGVEIAPGIIGVAALSGASGAVPANASDSSPDRVFAEGQPAGAPIGRDVLTRKPVDRRYMAAVGSAVQEAAGLWNMTPDLAAAQGWTVLPCPSTGGSTAATKVFVDCPDGAVYTNSFAFTGDDAVIIFNGDLKVEGGPGTALTFEDSRGIYVKGTDDPSDPSDPGVRVTRQLKVNNGSSTTCADRFAADRTARSKIVVGDGMFVGQGSAGLTMCQTSVIMAEDDGNCPIVAVYGRAPYDNACRGLIDVRGTGGLDWSAPNAADADPTQADFEQLEDLALWTESAGLAPIINRVEGGGAITLSGVFFLPNAWPFRVAGLGIYSNEANAQFVSRRLEVAGNAFLSMKPDADDVVALPYFGDFTLVR